MKRIALLLDFERFIEKSADYLMAAGGIVFIVALAPMPAEHAGTFLLGGIAVTGGLSSLCFSLAAPDLKSNEHHAARYAGEKLLHGAIMAVQAIMAKFTGALALKAVAGPKWLSLTVSGVFTVIAVGIGIYAMVASIRGLHCINAVLWQRFRERRAGLDAPPVSARSVTVTSDDTGEP